MNLLTDYEKIEYVGLKLEVLDSHITLSSEDKKPKIVIIIDNNNPIVSEEFLKKIILEQSLRGIIISTHSIIPNNIKNVFNIKISLLYHLELVIH